MHKKNQSTNEHIVTGIGKKPILWNIARFSESDHFSQYTTFSYTCFKIEFKVRHNLQVHIVRENHSYYDRTVTWQSDLDFPFENHRVSVNSCLLFENWSLF